MLNNLIVDRTLSDVQEVVQLCERANGGDATAKQRLETEDLKGAYNATDLNRVGNACLYLYNLMDRMGYLVPQFVLPKPDWTISDVPTSAQMQDYISNLNALKSVFSTAQSIPQNMDNLTFTDANNIEKLLVEIEDQIERISEIFIRCNMITAFCGTAYYIQN